MTEQAKWCPMRFAASPGGPSSMWECAGADCAWWHAATQLCATLLTAIAHERHNALLAEVIERAIADTETLATEQERNYQAGKARGFARND